MKCQNPFGHGYSTYLKMIPGSLFLWLSSTKFLNWIMALFCLGKFKTVMKSPWLWDWIAIAPAMLLHLYKTTEGVVSVYVHNSRSLTNIGEAAFGIKQMSFRWLWISFTSVGSLEHCLISITCWMKENKLKLNSDKVKMKAVRGKTRECGESELDTVARSPKEQVHPCCWTSSCH